jgi:hypothetical protein
MPRHYLHRVHDVVKDRTRRAANVPSRECLTGLEKKNPSSVTKADGTYLATVSIRNSCRALKQITND